MYWAFSRAISLCRENLRAFQRVSEDVMILRAVTREGVTTSSSRLHRALRTVMCETPPTDATAILPCSDPGSTVFLSLGKLIQRRGHPPLKYASPVTTSRSALKRFVFFLPRVWWENHCSIYALTHQRMPATLHRAMKYTLNPPEH